jgi:hypothetical protein
VKEDIPENVRADLKIHLVATIEEALDLALQPVDVVSQTAAPRFQMPVAN